MKPSIDASFDDRMLKGTAGAVIHDSSGKFIAAENGMIEWCLDMLEVIALKCGLTRIKFVVNSDNMDVIRDVNGK